MKMKPIEIAAKAGIKPDTYYHRVLRGWSVKDASSIPPVKRVSNGEKQRPPTPVRLSEDQEAQIMKAAKRAGIKLSTWIKEAALKALADEPKIKRVIEREDQERVG